MNNVENLKPIKDPEVARKLQAKSVIKRNENTRRKKNMKQTLELLLSLTLSSGKEYNIDQLKDFANLKGKNISVNEAIMVKQVQKALKGDDRAIEFIRDMTEPKTNNLNVSGELPIVIGGSDELKD